MLKTYEENMKNIFTKIIINMNIINAKIKV